MGCCPHQNPFEQFIETFLLINLGESSRRAGLEQALDLSKNVSEQAKKNLGNSP
jgi:hypothetical protein